MRFDGAAHRIILRLRLRDQCPGLPVSLADLDLGHPPVFVVGRDGVEIRSDVTGVLEPSVFPVYILRPPALRVNIGGLQSPIDVPFRLGADDTVYTVYRDRCLNRDRIGVMGRVVDRLDHLLLSRSGHKGGLGTVAVAVVHVGCDDVVVNSMGLGAGVRFAFDFGEVAVAVVGELGLMPHRINLPYRAVVGGLIIRLPLPRHCSVRGTVFDLLPLGDVAHLPVMDKI